MPVAYRHACSHRPSEVLEDPDINCCSNPRQLQGFIVEAAVRSIYAMSKCNTVSLNGSSEELIAESVRQFSTPQLIELAPHHYAAKFDLMKFIPAKAIIDNAIQTGKLQKGGRVIESSSGTFALALAIICSQRDLSLSLVTGQISDITRWRLEQLGAEVTVVPTANGAEGGIQQARLELLKQMLEGDPDAFWPQQYTNPLNPASYESFGRLIEERLPKIDILVASIGSGGSGGTVNLVAG